MPATPTSDKRQRKHDREGLGEAAELRSQDRVDQHHRQNQRLAHVSETLHHVLGLARVADDIAGRQVHGGGLQLDIVDHLAEGAALGVGADADFPRQVVAPYVGGRRSGIDRRHLAQRDQCPPKLAGKIQRQQVAAAAALRGVHPQANVVAVAVGVLELGDHFAGHQSAHGGGHRSEVEPQIAGGLAVEVHPEFRPGVLLAGVHIHRARHALGDPQQSPAQARHDGKVVAAQTDLDRFGAPRHVVRGTHRGAYGRVALQAFPKVRRDRKIVAALGRLFQLDVDAAFADSPPVVPPTVV